MFRSFSIHLLALVMTLCSCAPGGAAGDISALAAELDRAIPERMKQTGTPGAVAALVRGGQVVWVKAYGMADVENSIPMQPDSVFGVASISKTFTAWGVMKLVEAGKIELDAPIGRYVRSWKLPPGEYDPDGVTIRRLLSHSAGLNTPEYLGHLPGAAAPDIVTVLSNGDGRTPGLRMVNPPGSGFAYSDGGYLLLQLLVEEVSGEAFEAYMQREILDPLGIQDAGFAPSPRLIERLVTSYDINQTPLPKYEYVEKAPAGLYITARGMAQFAAASMRGPDGSPPGRGVIRPETIGEMHTQQVAIEGFERLIYADGYGLGYYTETVGENTVLVSHMGANLNGVTEFAAVPASGDAIVVLTTGISGQEVFADALHLWIRWLGYGAVTLPRAIRIARAGMFALAGLLNGLALIITISIVAEYRRRANGPVRRTKRGFSWLEALLILTPVSVVIFFFFGYPYLKIAMPSAAAWILCGWVWLCLLGPVWVFLRRRNLQPVEDGLNALSG